MHWSGRIKLDKEKDEANEKNDHQSAQTSVIRNAYSVILNFSRYILMRIWEIDESSTKKRSLIITALSEQRHIIWVTHYDYVVPICAHGYVCPPRTVFLRLIWPAAPSSVKKFSAPPPKKSIFTFIKKRCNETFKLKLFNEINCCKIHSTNKKIQ